MSLRASSSARLAPSAMAGRRAAGRPAGTRRPAGPRGCARPRPASPTASGTAPGSAGRRRDRARSRGAGCSRAGSAGPAGPGRAGGHSRGAPGSRPAPDRPGAGGRDRHRPRCRWARQRQQQRPVEQAPPRKLVGRDEPGRPGADHHDDDPDPGEQQGGVVQSRGQDVGEEVRPQPARALQRLEPERRDRRQDQEGGEAGGERPGREQEPGTPRRPVVTARGARVRGAGTAERPAPERRPAGRGRTIEIPVDQAVAIRQERPLPTRGRSTRIGATSRGIRVPSGRGRRRSRP